MKKLIRTFPILLAFCIAFAPIGQITAGELVTVDPISEYYLGCVHSAGITDASCFDLHCSSSVCVCPFSASANLAASLEYPQSITGLLLKSSDRYAFKFKSQVPLPLYRPPIS